MTQYQLAKQVGLTRRGILAIEKGEREIKLKNATRLAYALGVTIEDLFCVSSFLDDL